MFSLVQQDAACAMASIIIFIYYLFFVLLIILWNVFSASYICDSNHVSELHAVVSQYMMHIKADENFLLVNNTDRSIIIFSTPKNLQFTTCDAILDLWMEV